MQTQQRPRFRRDLCFETAPADYLLAEQPLIGFIGVAFLHLLALSMPTEVPVFGGVMVVPVEEPANAGTEANMVPIANAPIIESPRIAQSSPAETRLMTIMAASDGQYADQPAPRVMCRHGLARVLPLSTEFSATSGDFARRRGGIW